MWRLLIILEKGALTAAETNEKLKEARKILAEAKAELQEKRIEYNKLINQLKLKEAEKTKAEKDLKLAKSEKEKAEALKNLEDAEKQMKDLETKKKQKDEEIAKAKKKVEEAKKREEEAKAAMLIQARFRGIQGRKEAKEKEKWEKFLSSVKIMDDIISPLAGGPVDNELTELKRIKNEINELRNQYESSGEEYNKKIIELDEKLSAAYRINFEKVCGVFETEVDNVEDTNLNDEKIEELTKKFNDIKLRFPEVNNDDLLTKGDSNIWKMLRNTILENFEKKLNLLSERNNKLKEERARVAAKIETDRIQNIIRKLKEKIGDITSFGEVNPIVEEIKGFYGGKERDESGLYKSLDEKLKQLLMGEIQGMEKRDKESIESVIKKMTPGGEESISVQKALDKRLEVINTDEIVGNIEDQIENMKIDVDGGFPSEESIQNSIGQINDETKVDNLQGKLNTRKQEEIDRYQAAKGQDLDDMISKVTALDTNDPELQEIKRILNLSILSGIKGKKEEKLEEKIEENKK